MSVTIQDQLSGASVNLVRDLALDEDGDLLLVNGDLAFVSGPAAAKQGVQLRLGFFQGDCPWDLDAGVAYWTKILVKNPNLVGVREEFRLAILDTPDIADLLSLNLTYRVDRSLDVNYRATLVTVGATS